MEQTNTDQNSITLDSVTKKSYVDFFPSAFIQKTVNEKHSINLNYSRKIHRPDFKDLNPFQFYNSQYSIWTGNPNLKSEYINITELTYTFDNTYSFMVGHENIQNNYTYLAYQDDSTKITTYQATNFKVRNNFNVSVSINKEVTKWWMLSVQAQYRFFKYNSLVYNEVFVMSSNKFEISMDNTFVLPKEFKINLFAFYTSPHLDATDKMLSNGMVNLSISKSFFDNNLQIRLYGNDIFATLNNSYVTQFANVDSESHTRWSASFFGAAVTYNFQKGKKFQNTRVNKSNEEEKSRVGS
jgi:outer membrane receptor protein involved in Fe transport